MSAEEHSAETMMYLKNIPIAVLSGGTVGKTCATDIKLAGREIRLFGMMPLAEKTLASLGKAGILLDGVQRNRYCFERPDRAYFDVVTSNIGWAIKGVGLIAVAAPAVVHEPFSRALILHLKDGQVIHIFIDDYTTLLLRHLMRGMGCTRQVIVGGWSSAPYGTRSRSVSGFVFPHMGVKYRVITLHGASLPMSDIDAFMESVRYLLCIDAVTQSEGSSAGNTILGIGFAGINPAVHVPATILDVSTMENWGVIFGGHNGTTYSMYSHGLNPFACEVQYRFCEKEKVLTKKIDVGTPGYNYESFFSHRSVLTQEYMGLDENGKDSVVFPLDQPSNEGNTGPNNINHRYLTEDVPVGCRICHDLGTQYGVPAPIIDSMIVLAGAMHKKSFFETSKYNLAYLGTNSMLKEELLTYLSKGVYNR